MATESKDWKKEARKQWTKTPCGKGSGDDETLEYFLAIERNRYYEYAPWMKPFFNYSQYSEKKVLEIGHGQGTDLSQFALAGAECYGVDITKKHTELAKRNMQLRGLKAEFFIEDASKLHFDDNTFDVVYSFGVLHHTPDTIRCISEAYRVLKPGGEFIVALYNKYSAFHIFCVLWDNGLDKGNLKKLGYKGLLSTIEKGADGINIKPYVKLYTRRELGRILQEFSNVSIFVKHLSEDHFYKLWRIVPSSAIPKLEKRLGWYVIGKAIK